MNVENRTLFIADNLDILRGIDSETIDLITERRTIMERLKQKRMKDIIVIPSTTQERMMLEDETTPNTE